jgi:hypothetical protein
MNITRMRDPSSLATGNVQDFCEDVSEHWVAWKGAVL